MDLSNVNIAFIGTITIGVMLYKLARLICIIDIILYVIFMERFSTKKYMLLYVLVPILIYTFVSILIYKYNLENYYIIGAICYAVFIFQIISTIKIVSAIKSKE